MLRRVSREQPREWDRYIPALLFAYRELPNQTLGFSPFELVYGHSPRGPIDLLAKKWSGLSTQDEETKNIYQYVFDLHNRIRETCKLAQEAADINTDVYKSYADRKAKARSLAEGSKVLVLLTEEQNKLRILWKGPFTVIEKLSPVNYSIDMDGRKKVFHINMLKEYVERTNVAVNKDVLYVSDIVRPVPDIPMTDILPADFCPNVRTDAPTDVPTVDHDALVGLMTPTGSSDVIPLPVLSVLGESYKDVVVADDLTDKQTHQLLQVLSDYKDILTDKPGVAVGVEPHQIQTTTDVPIRVKPYPLPFAKRVVVEKEIQTMLKLGVIEPSTSPYSSPVVLVGKPDGSVRFCIDYRQLNKNTVFDAEPIPDVEDLLCQISDGHYFVKIDLTKGYWQIPMADNDRKKTAFQTPFGLYQWTRMPFGLMNAPATFARMMRALKLHECGAVSFFDDILLAQREWNSLLTSLKTIFKRLRAFGLTARPSKIRAEHTGITPGRRLGSEKDAPVPQSRAHQREQPEEPVGCLRGLLIRGARRLPPEFCDVRSPTGCLSIILYERGYSSCIRSIGERVPRPGPQYASDGVSTVSADCTKVFRQ
ncbi:hypothetical protein ACOMHN_013239 [Nucella lapillus]